MRDSKCNKMSINGEPTYCSFAKYHNQRNTILHNECRFLMIPNFIYLLGTTTKECAITLGELNNTIRECLGNYYFSYNKG